MFTDTHGAVATLDRPGHAGELDFSADPKVTPQDVRTALGPQADDMMAEAQIDVDELIRLINAETTLLPPIIIPDEAAEDRSGRSLKKAQAEPDQVLATATKTWKKRFLKGTVLAILITLTGGGAAAMAMNKSVTVEVDGQEQTVRSFGGTVGEVLEDAGLSVGAHDALSPSPQAAVGDGGVIKLERGRKLNLIVDGAQRESWVRATDLSQALGQLGLADLNKQGTWFSMPQTGALPLEGATVEIKTLKNIMLFDGANEPRPVATNAVTTQEFLGEQKLTLGPEDAAEGGLDFKLVDGAEVHVSRTGVSVENKEEEITPEVEKIDDPELEKGKTEIDDPGTPGKKLVTYKVTKKNDQETAREEVETKVLVEAKPKKMRVGTKKADVPPISDAGVWDRIAQCESGGNWAAVNPTGKYHGGLQFDKQTWQAYGGGQYAETANKASREQQIAIATKVRDARGGYGAWPHCGKKA
ncbi:resuscitation-promoting factor [Amycolatopsis nigrescens]|uniref:resuscitation-promoting factor n=1 Tax=Amycolatopsis nigrescens TaxID=381445 RepID=UPI000362E3B8|nr:resuscitation-promoting factor [Amycolatopsis nigrescens]